VPRPRTPTRDHPPARTPTRPWTPEQENLVRVYHDMGLSPRQIVERCRSSAPRLGIDERLVVRILSSPRPSAPGRPSVPGRR
jgi:hypothetical protein